MSQAGSLGAENVTPGSLIESFTTNDGNTVDGVSNNIDVLGLAANPGGNAYPIFTYGPMNGVVYLENRAYLTPYVVDHSTTDGSKGTFTTIQAAITQAVADSYAGDIFIRPGTYTENLTLAAGVNLVAQVPDSDNPQVIILGTCTFTGAGVVSIANIEFETNGSYAIAITGSAASVLDLVNCFINCANNTGIHYTSSSSSSSIILYNTNTNLGTTGVALYTKTSPWLY